jgi:Protein of unknown function (DUF3298).
MRKQAKKAVIISALLIAATLFLGGCSPKPTASSSQQPQASSASPASSAPSSSAANSIEASSTASKPAPAVTFEVSIQQTFSKKYTDPKLGDWGEVSYSRPVFSGTAPSVKKLNDYYDQLEAKWKTENEEAVKENLDILKNSQHGGSTYGNTVECKITYNKNGVLSIMADNYIGMAMAAHPNTERSSHTFDTGTGQELLLTDVLKVTQATAADAVAKEFTALKNSDSRYENINIQQVQKAGANTKFYVSADGVCLYFNPYEIASYAEGLIEDTIPFSRKDLIADRFAQ